MPSRLNACVRLVPQTTERHNSSTDFVARQGSPWHALASAARRNLSEFGEVALLTTGSRHPDEDVMSWTSQVWMTERNESVSARIIPIRNPNGKDSLNSAVGLLLKPANAPEMKQSADEPRQQSVAADGQVMDRGAEGAAGGCDAI